MTPKWLDQNLIHSPIQYTLCTTEEQYLAECKRLDIKYPSPWVGARGNATTHHLEQGQDRASIVCIRALPDKTPVQIAALLVHEAVHLWQEYIDHIGEHSESREFEAYSIQWLSQQLMEEYVRQTVEPALDPS